MKNPRRMEQHASTLDAISFTNGSVLRPDLTQNSGKRVLKSKTPRKQFCLRCTFPRFDTAGAKTFYQRKTWVRIIMKLLTFASRLKLLSRSFWSNQNCYSARRNIFKFHFRSQKCEQICEQIWLQNWAVELQGKSWFLRGMERGRASRIYQLEFERF